MSTVFADPTEQQQQTQTSPAGERRSNLLGRPITPADCAIVSEPVFKPHPFGQGRTYTPDHQTLISIFPEKRTYTPKALHGGMRTTYTIDAAPKGQYSKLVVYDTFITIRRPQRSENEPEEMQQAPAPAMGVARDMIRAWAEDAPGNASGSKPGFLICEGADPTQLELEGLWAQQTNYFRYLVEKADEHQAVGLLSQITEDHRRALRWLGSEDRVWYKKVESVLFKPCPACGEDIRIMATICKHCQGNLIKYYKETGIEVTAEIDPGVFNANTLMKARNEEVRRQDAIKREQEKSKMTAKYGPRGTENRKELVTGEMDTIMPEPTQTQAQPSPDTGV